MATLKSHSDRSIRWYRRTERYAMSPRKKERIKEAAERREAREERGDKSQLAKLIRLGHGHCKEADRLRVKVT